MREPLMGSESIVRVFATERLPMSCHVVRILATEEVPYGTGTATRTAYTLLVRDHRYWMTGEEKDAEPLFGGRGRG